MALSKYHSTFMRFLSNKTLRTTNSTLYGSLAVWVVTVHVPYIRFTHSSYFRRGSKKVFATRSTNLTLGPPNPLPINMLTFLYFEPVLVPRSKTATRNCFVSNNLSTHPCSDIV
nr:hypothetical protein Iba_scaffold47585CG0010 [Ipomoea batatas]GME09449.1 hypothetical protein Iba_scaffold8718CG0030 [Ipomoea batatas]GME12846.1 hypothetical protein Iba_scaffold14184CG0010 [Ipomoea batatas]